MTREERAGAISFFETMLKLESNIKDANFRYSKLALEALKQEHCEDCISREKVSELLNEGWWKGIYPREAIMALPSVMPQPKMGYWEWNQYDSNPKIGNFHCSLCHTIGRAYYDYCPGCGAKMSEIPTGAEEVRNEE